MNKRIRAEKIIPLFLSGTAKRYKSSVIKLHKIKEEGVQENIRRMFSSPYLYLGLGAFIGVLVAIQFKTESSRPLNPVLSYNRFIDLKNDYEQEREKLVQESRALKDAIREKEDQVRGRNGLPSALLSELTEQQMIYGEFDVSGEGVVITLSDGELQIQDEITKSLVHAADLRDIVNLLWYSGAEAISINGERITYNTSIDCIVSTILINTNNYAPPFTIKAIGSSSDLYGVLGGSRKLVDIKKRADKKQISFSLNRSGSVLVEKSNSI